ncbi:transporter [Rhodobacterales bacterium HKCCE2091]|nr:transporter [Rhodobacterales bacterium HKCCE2091]
MTFSHIGGAAAALAMTASAALAQDSHNFSVVGTWGVLAHWQEREQPFWDVQLPEASGGRLTATARPLTELGMDGTTVMRELRSGAFDFAHGVFLYVAGDSPVIEGGDLTGVTPDLATFRQVMEVYEPVLEEEFQTLFNSHILMLYAWPQTHLYCNLGEDVSGDVGLDAFQGLNVRSFGASMADFITETLDATPVAVAFGEVLPSLERGALDCGASGTLSAYAASWYQGATHDLQVSLGYTASFLAVNNDVWNGLSDEDRALIEEQVAILEEEMWTATEADSQAGIDCMAEGPCDGELGHMTQVTLSDAALEQMRETIENGVLTNWAERCEARSPGCVDNWNATIGQLLGYEARL